MERQKYRQKNTSDKQRGRERETAAVWTDRHDIILCTQSDDSYLQDPELLELLWQVEPPWGGRRKWRRTTRGRLHPWTGQTGAGPVVETEIQTSGDVRTISRNPAVPPRSHWPPTACLNSSFWLTFESTWRKTSSHLPQRRERLFLTSGSSFLNTFLLSKPTLTIISIKSPSDWEGLCVNAGVY